MAIAILVIAGLLLLVRRGMATEMNALFQVYGSSPQVFIWVYTLLSLPGVAAHEMAHFFMAALFGFRTGKIDLLPRLNSEGGVELGSVEVERHDPIRQSLVGLAPLLMGIALISWLASLSHQTPVIKYFIVVITLHLFPSQKDMTSWPIAAICIGLLVSIWWVVGFSIPSFSTFESRLVGISENLFSGLLLTLLLTAGITLVLWLTRLVSQQLLHRKISYCR